MKNLRVGIVGAGFGQHVLVPAFRSVEGCEVVSICASRAEKAREVAALLSIPKSYAHWEDMLSEEELDLVAVATPADVQPAVVKQALKRGIAVFAEKPLAVDAADSRDLVRLAEDAGRAAVVDFEFPFVPAWKHAHSLLHSGVIGLVREVRFEWSMQIFANKNRLENWKTDFSKGGGPLQSFGSHMFHNLEWFLGPIESLTCKQSKVAGDPRAIASIAKGALRFRSGVTGSWLIHTDEPNGRGHIVEFMGAEGTLRLEAPPEDYIKGFKLFKNDEDITATVSPDWSSGPRDGRVLAVREVIRNLTNWIETGERAPNDFQSGHRAQCLIEAASRSHENGGAWVERISS